MRACLLTAAAAASLLSACAHAQKPPQITYDDAAFRPAQREADAAPATPKPVEVVELPTPLPLPGQLKPLPASAKAEPAEAADPRRRVSSANASARVQPSRDGYLNAVQVYAQIMGRDTGQAVEPAKLVGPMLAKFMAADRAFAKVRRATGPAEPLSQAVGD